MKIELQIRECKNGFIVEDSYFGEECPVKSWDEAVVELNNLLKKYNKEITNMHDEAEKTNNEEALTAMKDKRPVIEFNRRDN